MKTNNKIKFAGLTSLVPLAASVSLLTTFLGSASTGLAQAITVPDFSFETPNETGTYQDNSGLAAGSAIPNTGNAWYYLGGLAASFGGSPVGVQDASANGFTAGANPNGTQVGYANDGSWMSSGILTTIAANTTYTLTISEGNRGGGFAQSSGFTFALGFGSGVSTALTNSANWASSLHVTYAGSPAVGAFGDYTTQFTTGSSGSLIGQSLLVLLGSDVNGDVNPVDYDNVRLVATAVPEPGSLSLAAAGGVAALCFVRRFKKI